jgi:hypothetical protein
MSVGLCKGLRQLTYSHYSPYLSLPSGRLILAVLGFSWLGLAPLGHPRQVLCGSKIAVFHLKLIAACIGVGLMGPGHCLNIDKCLYCVLQLFYHWWRPILGLQFMEYHKKVPRLGNVLHFVGQWGFWWENGIGDSFSPSWALRSEHNFPFLDTNAFCPKGKFPTSALP